MKRIIVPIIIVLSAVILTACATDNLGDASSPSDASSSQPDSQENTQANATLNAVYEQLKASELLPEMIAADKSSYGIETSDYSAAVFYKSSDDNLTDEVLLVTASDEEAAERVEQALYSWLDKKAEEAKKSSNVQYAIIASCYVEKNGNNLALIISSDAEKLTNIYLENINL